MNQEILKELDKILPVVVRVHGEHHPELSQVTDLYAQLKAAPTPEIPLYIRMEEKRQKIRLSFRIDAFCKLFCEQSNVRLGRFPAVFLQIYIPDLPIPEGRNTILGQKRALQLRHEKMLCPAEFTPAVDDPKGGNVLPGQVFPESIADLPGVSWLAAEHGNLPIGCNASGRNGKADDSHFFIKCHEEPPAVSQILQPLQRKTRAKQERTSFSRLCAAHSAGVRMMDCILKIT